MAQWRAMVVKWLVIVAEMATVVFLRPVRNITVESEGIN